MRETRGSLRAYFILAAVFIGAPNLHALALENGGSVHLLLAAVNVLLAFGFVLAGIFLPQLLRSRVFLLKWLIYCTICSNIIPISLMAFMNPVPVAIAVPGIGLVVGWYLLVNIARLAREEEASLRNKPLN